MKWRIFHWENAIKDNPAVLGVALIAVLALVFIGAIYFDVYRKARRRQRRRTARAAR